MNIQEAENASFIKSIVFEGVLEEGIKGQGKCVGAPFPAGNE